MEELSGIYLTSTVKRSRDDFLLVSSRASILDVVLPEWSQEESQRQSAQLEPQVDLWPRMPGTLAFVRQRVD